MVNYVSCVKGVSGSGKSTRVFLFLKFLQEKCGLTPKDFVFNNFEGKDKVVGILFEELDLVFIGKKYVTGNFERFQGYDVMTGYFGRSSYFSDFLRDNSGKYSFIIEGAGVTGTNRLRPLFLHEYCGFNNIMVQYYNYDLDQKDLYLERIFYRSGKYPNKGTMWDKCSGFISDHRDSLKEINTLRANDTADLLLLHAFYNYHIAPTYDFGVKMLAFLDMDDFTKPFMEYCIKSNYTDLNSFKNFQYGNKE